MIKKIAFGAIVSGAWVVILTCGLSGGPRAAFAEHESNRSRPAHETFAAEGAPAKTDFISVKDFGATGDGVTDDLPAFKRALTSLAKPPDSRGHFLFVPYGIYHLSDTLHISRQMVIQGSSGAGWNAGTVLKFDPGVTGVVIDRTETSLDGGAGDWTVIRDIAIEADNSQAAQHRSALKRKNSHGSRQAKASGILLRARASIENCHVAGFSGSGIEVNASVNIKPPTNANQWQVRNCFIEENSGDGLHVIGSDANTGLASLVSLSHNGGWGINDESFLGNTYVGCSTASNKIGAYRSSNANARNVFVGCYAEGDQAASEIRSPAMVIGGLFGPLKGTGTYLIDGNLSPGVSVTNNVGGVPVALAFGGNAAGSVLTFTAPDSLPYALKFAQSGKGWWDFVYGNLDSAVPLSISTAAAPEGSGQIKFTNGYFIGSGENKIHHMTGAAAPAAGAHRRGDIVYNTQPAAGGYVGWICIAAGAPGTWKPFGRIEQ